MKILNLIGVISIIFSFYFCHSNRTNLHQVNKSNAEMIFDNKTIDFGRVSSDTTVIASYHFTNSGKDTLIIEYVNPDCTCTDYTISSKKINPNETGIIKLLFNTKNRKGEQKIYAVVKANTKSRFYRLLMVLKIE